MGLVIAGLVAGGLTIFTGGDGAPGDDPTTTPNGSGKTKKEGPVKRGGYLEAACDIPARWANLIYRGWAPGKTRDFDLSIVPDPPNYMGTFVDTSHSGPYDFLQEVPLVLYGPGFVKEMGHTTVDREVTIADIAPTTAELTNFDWPARGQSQPLTEVIEDGAEKPKLILTIVIDGGGWNVLREHPDAWPNIRDLIERGANVDGAIAGSSPSITPAIHTNIGTGTFPRQHGVTAIAVRHEKGDLVGAFTPVDNQEGVSIVDPTINLRQETFADMYDRAVGNEAKIALLAPGNYQLGMIGHGLGAEGGDADIVTSLAKTTNEWSTNPTFYFAPEYVNTEVEGPEEDLSAVDAADGEMDDQWRDHDFPSNVVATPALASWQNRLIQEIIDRADFGDDEVTDLFQINYKAPDSVGHIYNMLSAEEEDTLRSVDTAVGEMVDYLDAEVGAGEWAMMLTADHGQTPLEAGGWPISRSEIKLDIDRHFGLGPDDLSLLEQTSASSFFMRREELAKHNVTPEEVADYLTGYTIGDNIAEGNDVPEGYENRLDDRIFAAIIPGRKISKVATCTGAMDG